MNYCVGYFPTLEWRVVGFLLITSTNGGYGKITPLPCFEIHEIKLRLNTKFRAWSGFYIFRIPQPTQCLSTFSPSLAIGVKEVNLHEWCLPWRCHITCPSQVLGSIRDHMNYNLQITKHFRPILCFYTFSSMLNWYNLHLIPSRCL